jgi:class 3 adenylate cyclase
MMDLDIRDVLPAIRVPTLVMCRGEHAPHFRRAARFIADHVPDARLVELPGHDTTGIAHDWRPVAEQIERFVTGSSRALDADRVLATVLFTDIVGSTELVLRDGDRRWRERLEGHNITVRRLLADHGGREVNTTGDGFVATFDRPGNAIRCASGIRETLHADGLQVRAALHAGEVEVLGDDIGGLTVHIASRILGTARDGEVLVSRTVRDLVAGADIAFDDRGEHHLKDLPESWRLFAV